MNILKIMGKCILASLAFILALWALLFLTLQTSLGQQAILAQFIRYAERRTQTRIQVDHIHFSFPFNIQLEKLSVSQDDQPLIHIEQIELACAYPPLLEGRFICSHLRASGIDLFHLPEQKEVQVTEPRDISWNLHPWPFYVKIENLDLQKIHLAPQLVDQLSLPSEIKQIINLSALNLQGVVSNNPFKEAISAHLLLTVQNGTIETSPLIVGIDTQNHFLSFSLHMKTLPLYLAHPPLSSLKTHLALSASAPIQTWQDFAQNISGDHPPIEGYFKISLHTFQDQTLLSNLIGEKSVFKGHYLLPSRQAVELFDLQLHTPHGYIEGETILTANREIHHGNFKGKIENLKHFQRWLGEDAQGIVHFEGHATGPVNSPSLIVNLESPSIFFSKQILENIQATLHAQPQEKGWEGFLTFSLDHQATPWKMASSFIWDDQQHIQLSHLRVNALHSIVEGEVSYSTADSIWEGSLTAQIGNLHDIAQFLEHPISGEAQLQVNLMALPDSRENKRQGFHIDFSGHTLKWNEWQANQLAFNLYASPLHEGEEAFQVYSRVEGEHVRWKEIQVDHCLANGRYRSDLTHQMISHLSLEWIAHNLQWATGQAARITGYAHLPHALKDKVGDVEVNIQNMLTSTTHFEELKGSSRIDFAQNEWPFYLEGQGKWKEDFAFASDGIWHYQQEIFDLQVHQLHGHFGPYPLAFLHPLHMHQEPDLLQIQGLFVRWGEGEFQGEFQQNHQALTSQFHTNAIPSELFHFIAPTLPLVGRATFRGQLGGTLQHPTGQLEIDLHQVQTTEDLFAKNPFIEGKVQLELDKHGGWVQSELYGIGHTPVMIAGRLPLSLSLDPPSFVIDPHLPFHLALQAEGELEPYLHLLYHDTTNLAGHTTIALELSGQMEAPQIRGYIDLKNGTYESLSTGAIFHNIHAHLEGNGSKVVLTQFSAEDSKGGAITATGGVTIDASQNFPLDFQIYPKQIFIVNSDHASLSASGPLTLTGNYKHAILKGKLTVDHATVHLKENLPRQIKTVDIHYINLPDGESLPSYLEPKETHSAITLAIDLDVPGNFTIDGDHLTSEWKGLIHVTGTPNRPILNGDLRVMQGEYDLKGKVFQLSQGTIHIAGPLGKKTTLYVVASKDIDRIHAEIIAKGPVTKPVFRFRSNPPLSQQEVLSYILFNRGTSDITTDQGEQLSQSFIALSSDQTNSSDDDFLSRIRNNIGIIDHLDFVAEKRSGENADIKDNDFALQVGKHITEKIFVSMNKSINTVEAYRVAVEYDLHKNLKAQAQMDVSEEKQLLMSLKWKKDY